MMLLVKQQNTGLNFQFKEELECTWNLNQCLSDRNLMEEVTVSMACPAGR